MSNNKEIEDFKTLHKGDLKTLLQIYWSNKPIYKSIYFRSSFILAIATIIIIYITNASFYSFLDFLAIQITSIMPNILGFNLGGYVLLIGLNSQSILNEITEPDLPKSKYSLFQKQSSVFAFSILIQATAILLAFIVNSIIEIGDKIIINSNLALSFNLIALILFCTISYYSILLIGQIILNIFNFGQILHFYVRINESDSNN